MSRKIKLCKTESLIDSKKQNSADCQDDRDLVLLALGLLILAIHLPISVFQKTDIENKQIISYLWVSGSSTINGFFELKGKEITAVHLEKLGKKTQENSPSPLKIQESPSWLLMADNNYQLKPFSPQAAHIFLKPIPINYASAGVLTSIPGLGEKLSTRIIEYRNKTGWFNNLEDLNMVNGIGPGKMKAMKNYISFETPY
jgi:competence ComEA-like helix-hairpin-helix protein